MTFKLNFTGSCLASLSIKWSWIYKQKLVKKSTRFICYFCTWIASFVFHVWVQKHFKILLVWMEVFEIICLSINFLTPYNRRFLRYWGSWYLDTRRRKEQTLLTLCKTSLHVSFHQFIDRGQTRAKKLYLKCVTHIF